MDLKLEDVAELLNVSEKTVHRWITQSKIPYYRLHRQLRFNRGEIETWVLDRQREGEFPLGPSQGEHSSKLGIHQYSLFRSIHRGEVFWDVGGSNKEEVIHSTMERISPYLNLDPEILSELLLDREKMMSTALSKGVAVPHTRDFLLQDAFDFVAIVFLPNPIAFGALDGQDVHTLFFLFACDDKRHLHLLSKIANLSQDEERVLTLRESPSKGALLESIRHWEEELLFPSISKKPSLQS